MSGAPPRRRPQAVVRFYFDADVLGLAKIVGRLRPDVTYPGDPGGLVHGRERAPCPIESAAVPDEEWIPLVAARGWSVITRDRRITTRRAELAAVRDARARLFVLSARESLDTWGQLEVLMRRWQDIERLSAEDGPLVISLGRSGLTRLTVT